jgi:hypothetical protein
VADPNDVCSGLVPPAGSVTVTGTAPDLTTVANLEDALNSDSDVTVLWVTTVKADTGANPGATGVKFTLTAALGSTARGHRLETFFKGAACK